MKFTGKKKKKENCEITWRAKKTGVWENFIHAISRCQKRLMSVPTSSRSLLKTTIKDQVLFSKQMDIVVFNVGWGNAEVRICSEHSELTTKNATQPCSHSIIKIGVKNNGDEIPRGEHRMPLWHDSSLQLKYLVQKCIDGRLQAAPLIIIFPTYWI